ncbi:MAG: DUF3500 domain-containing protein [Geminicoccaceae bacterium]
MIRATAQAIHPGIAWDLVDRGAAKMADAARVLVDRLDPGQRALTLFPLAAEARRDWDYRPRRRPGLPLRDMREDQRAACWRLVDSVLSESGAAKARGVLALEAILQERTSNKAFRDPLNYALTLFGTPGDGPWAWRFEGHHLSLTVTLAPGVGMAVTPHFLGANPLSGRVVEDGHGGLERVLERESALAFAAVDALTPAEFSRALIAPQPPPDFLTGPGREDSLREPAGLALGQMRPDARGLVERIVEAFLGHLAPDYATPLGQALRAAGIDTLHFAWAGGTTPDRLHYYRLHGPTLLIEYDRTDADHAHSVWHDPRDHFGEDQLRRHRELAHDHP